MNWCAAADKMRTGCTACTRVMYTNRKVVMRRNGGQKLPTLRRSPLRALAMHGLGRGENAVVKTNGEWPVRTVPAF